MIGARDRSVLPDALACSFRMDCIYWSDAGYASLVGLTAQYLPELLCILQGKTLAIFIPSCQQDLGSSQYVYFGSFGGGL